MAITKKMASVRRWFLVSTGGKGRGLRPCCSESSSLLHDNLHRPFSSSPPDPLLLRLLHLPRSQIKSTLHSVASSSSHDYWDALVSGLSSSSSPQKAQLVLEWRLERMLEDNETDQNQYSNLIALCAKIRNVPLAMHVFTAMEAHGIKPTTPVFNSLIHACLSSNSVITALSLFEIMESSEEYRPDPETYDTFVLGFSNLRDVSKMQAWYAAKRAAGFPANLQNYENIIMCCVKAKDFDGANIVYEEMMSSGVMPSVLILECVLEGLCKRQDCNRVKDFLKFLLECRYQINGNMIENVVALYSELGKADEMEELLETLTGLNQVGEALQRVHRGIIRMYALSDRLDDVEYSVGRMMSQGMSFGNPGEVEKVITLYFRQEAYDRLDVFLEHIKSYYKLTRSTYDLLVAGYRRAGLKEKLDSVMKDMEMAAL